MGVFKAACVAWDTDVMPDWVSRCIKTAGIDFVAHKCESSAQVLAVGQDADVIWVMGGSKLITAEIMPQFERCGAIIRSGSGTDNIPVEAATECGIIVANTPDATALPVAEHAVGLLLAVAREIPIQDRLVRQGKWNPKALLPRMLLHGSTAGLIGFGRIARGVATRLQAFGMDIIACDPQVGAAAMGAVGVRAVELPELLAGSDFISIHTPLLPATRHLIGAAELAMMKPTSVLINTARGPVVDTLALAQALKAGQIAAAGLDVLEQEPPVGNEALIGLENVVLTPHTAGMYEGFLDEFWRLSVDTVIDLSHQKWPLSYVNPTVKSRWALMPR